MSKITHQVVMCCNCGNEFIDPCGGNSESVENDKISMMEDLAQIEDNLGEIFYACPICQTDIYLTEKQY